MRIAVTGGTGFIGRRVVALLRERDIDVVVVGRQLDADVRADLLSSEAPKVVADIAATHIVHLAWATEPSSFWNTAENIEWTAASLRIMRAAYEAGVVRFVAAGTCAEYVWPSPDCEEDRTPLKPSTLYATAKDAFRRVAQAYALQEGAEFAWGRTFFVYGPGEPPAKLVSSVISDLRAGRQPQLRDLERRLDFVYVDDVARAFVDLTVSAGAVGAYNIGSGHLYSIGEVVDLVRRVLGTIGRASDVRSMSANAVGANLARSRSAFGFAPQVRFEQGIALTARLR